MSAFIHLMILCMEAMVPWQFVEPIVILVISYLEHLVDLLLKEYFKLLA
jgi:hypothetical protein